MQERESFYAEERVASLVMDFGAGMMEGKQLLRWPAAGGHVRYLSSSARRNLGKAKSTDISPPGHHSDDDWKALDRAATSGGTQFPAMVGWN